MLAALKMNCFHLDLAGLSIVPIFRPMEYKAIVVRTHSREKCKHMIEIKESIDIMWVLVSAALVFLMQAGFLTLETGLDTQQEQYQCRY